MAKSYATFADSGTMQVSFEPPYILQKLQPKYIQSQSHSLSTAAAITCTMECNSHLDLKLRKQ
jgi:hypothetical protein